MKMKNQEGWLAIEAMAAVVMMLISVPIFYNLWAFSKAEEEQAVIAGQLKTVAQDFESYVHDNYAHYKAVQHLQRQCVTFARLKTAGYVKAGLTVKNTWGQGYVSLCPSAKTWCS